MIKRGKDEPKEEMKASEGQGVPDGSQSGASQAPSDMEKSKDVADGTSGAKKSKDEEKKKKESMSVNSQITSSYVDTSEDDEAKKREAERAARRAKKGLSPAELEAIVDIELTETPTKTLLHIPGTYVKPETERHAEAIKVNKAYEELKKSKIGSDLYTMRGTQTLNPAKKEKVHHFEGFKQVVESENSSNWEIAEAQHQKDLKDYEEAENQYKKSIEDIMNENLKTPDCLFDAESLATHISIVTTQSGTKGESGAPG